MAREMLMMEMAEDYTGLSKGTIREAVKRGELRAYRPGGGAYSRLYFRPEDLDEWLDNAQVSA